jgi:hypothetical protein
VFGAGGGGSSFRHNGAYVGAGLEYLLWRVSPAFDIIGGVDYQHIWLKNRDDLDANGVIHRMRADDDLVRARLIVKLNPWGF